MASSLLLFDQPKSLVDILLEHQTKQSQLNRVLSSELAALWPLLTRDTPIDPTILAQAALLIRQYGLAAGAIGGAAYLAYRVLAAPNGYRFKPPAPQPIPLDQIETSLGWATRAVGHDDSPETLPAALTKAQGAAQRLVTNTGREALVQSVGQDSEAVGWRRIPSGPDACAFCRLMSIRGPVYKSAETAGRNANLAGGFVGAGAFKFHDHCECTAVPVFRDLSARSQVPAHVEQWISEWDATYRAETAGFDGQDKLNAFRRAVEG